MTATVAVLVAVSMLGAIARFLRDFMPAADDAMREGWER